MHVIVVVYVLLLLDHADAKFNMFVKNQLLSKFLLLKTILLISEFFSSSVKMSLKLITLVPYNEHNQDTPLPLPTSIPFAYRVEPPSSCSTISHAERPTISICLSCLNPNFSAASNNFFLHS